MNATSVRSPALHLNWRFVAITLTLQSDCSRINCLQKIKLAFSVERNHSIGSLNGVFRLKLNSKTGASIAGINGGFKVTRGDLLLKKPSVHAQCERICLDSKFAAQTNAFHKQTAVLSMTTPFRVGIFRQRRCKYRA
ncbi:MAG: hypothetical protein QUV35_12920 [Hydrogenophaga sp.]|uniref:hypothetical protein n=1 Tax=Hydrogenophaga sp. TaxID=1904254 RepID=UPI00263328AC|nr:hypothetical protein [Hydrogenophaga sp.]MDM7943519.1 hypothetical protein [Hydrogenophaga sp.]